MPNLRIFLCVFMSLWAMGNALSVHLAITNGGIIPASHQSQMVGINAGAILADVVKRDFIMRPFCAIGQIANEQHVSCAMGLELPFLFESKAFNDYAVTESVFGCSPKPASIFKQCNVFNESVQQWSGWFSNHNKSKKPTHPSAVKSAHEPQPTGELENMISCVVPLQGNRIISKTMEVVNA